MISGGAYGKLAEDTMVVWYLHMKFEAKTVQVTRLVVALCVATAKI